MRCELSLAQPRLTRSNLITATDLLKDKGLKAFAKKVVKKLIGRA
jgi:hypothetical protein